MSNLPGGEYDHLSVEQMLDLMQRREEYQKRRDNTPKIIEAQNSNRLGSRIIGAINFVGGYLPTLPPDTLLIDQTAENQERLAALATKAAAVVGGVALIGGSMYFGADIYAGIAQGLQSILNPANR